MIMVLFKLQNKKKRAKFLNIFKGAIFCKRPTRRLEIFSFNQNSGNGRSMKLELWQTGKLISSVALNYFQVGDNLMRK